jgi:benzoate-CoA ligase family protein
MQFENEEETGHEVLNGAILVDEAARRFGDRVVLYHYESQSAITYNDVARVSNRIGNALRALGVEAENRVAILMDDCPGWVYAFFGALKIGAVPTPLNTLLAEKDYAFFLNDSRAKVLFIDASYLNKVEDVISGLPHLRSVVVCNGSNLPVQKGRMMDWETFIQGASGELEIEPTCSGDVALFFYTSGSTGRPRAIMHSHSSLVQWGAFNRDVEGLLEGDIQFNIPKLYFSVSLGAVIGAFDGGYAVVLLSGRPEAALVLKVIARYRPAVLRGPPTIFARMVEAAKEVPDLCDLSSVRYIFCSGEALSPELFQRFKETFGVTLYNNWGSNECCTSPLAWRCGEEVPLEKVGSVGKSPVPGTKVKIVDEYGKELPNGTTGEIMVQARTQFLGYWHELKQTALKLSEGWYKPGDFFMRDQDGYYWFRGRKDDMLKIGGRQIFSVEVEEEVARHMAVLENAVIPVKNELGLTELHAFVILRGGYRPSPELAKEIQSLVKERLAPYKRPHHVVFVSELPKTATGKIQRLRLREQAQRQKRESGGAED